MAQKKFVLKFCGSKKNPQCPEVTITAKQVRITDDFGGSIKLTRQEFRRLQKVRTTKRGSNRT